MYEELLERDFLRLTKKIRKRFRILLEMVLQKIPFSINL
jgi:hypothetical protein